MEKTVVCCFRVEWIDKILLLNTLSTQSFQNINQVYTTEVAQLTTNKHYAGPITTE